MNNATNTTSGLSNPTANGKFTLAGDLTLSVGREVFREVCAALKDDHRFDLLVDLCGVDFPKRAERFEVVAHLYSFAANRRVRVKTAVGEEGAVPSLVPVFSAANWPEREAWDMFGIRFAGHPDLRRILMPADWQGHPQRKDYPLEGPGELLMESPQDWLKARQTAVEADIE